jgi:hypothetical protein
MTFENTIGKMPGQMTGVELPAEVSTEWLQTHGKRCLYQLADGAWFHAGLMPNGLGGHFILLSKEARAAACVGLGDTVAVTLAPDTSEFQFPMPEEWAEVLATDPAADVAFRALKPGRQRALIYLIHGVKSPDKRIEKALRLAEYIKLGINDPRKMKL